MKRPRGSQIWILVMGLITSVACRGDTGLMATRVVHFYGSNGILPIGELFQGSDGLLYGATAQGGDFGHGTIFKTTLDGCLTTLFSFGGPNGSFPCTTPLCACNVDFYGVPSYVGLNLN